MKSIHIIVSTNYFRGVDLEGVSSIPSDCRLGNAEEVSTQLTVATVDTVDSPESLNTE